jgi:hypothetical protein
MKKTFPRRNPVCEAGGSITHLDQGIAVTSHAAQGKTVDQVIVSAPVLRIDVAGALGNARVHQLQGGA